MKQSLNLHKSLDVLHLGCQEPHAYIIPYGSRASALKGLREESDRFLTLCGEWDFRFCKSERELGDFLSDTASYDRMTVPMSWQMALGRGYDVPHYTNVRYPFPIDPPHVPSENPCGVYKRSFYVGGESLATKSIRMIFEGVDSCFYLYINGRFVGYSQVSHMTSEFVVNDYLVAGENSVCVLVFKWCDGSYLEDQDKIRLSGIFREVYLLLRDKICVEDLYVRARTESPYDKATVRAELTLGGKATVEYELLSPSGESVATGSVEADGSALLEIGVDSPKLWNDESPALYCLLLTCGDEIICQEVGIREIVIRNRVIYVNGKKLKAKGVNRHDSHPMLGSATPVEHMVNDLLLLKRHNVNFIRTSHYPNDPRFLELCNRYGFWLCDEADLETHGMEEWGKGNWNALTESPDWTESYLDRARRMMERDKNQCCVLMWSVGNESGIGQNHVHMGDYFHKRMPGCIVHAEDTTRRRRDFERKGMKEELAAIPTHFFDVDSRMYPSLEDYYLYYHRPGHSDKPFFLCEYSHSMGNSAGDFEAYWELIWKNDNFFGGCVWEMTDHSVDLGTPGKPKYIYGGDMGNLMHDGCFCVDGLVYPDRRPHTALLELKQVLRPCRLENVDFEKASILLRNYRYYTDLSDLDIFWKVESEGKTVRQGRFPALALAPQRRRRLNLPKDTFADLAGECYLTLSYRQNRATAWADEGYEVGFDQVKIPAAEICRETVAHPTRPMTVLEEDYTFTVCNGDAIYRVDRLNGLIVSVCNRGKELLSAPLTPNVWRAPTDNDRKIRREWESWGYDRMNLTCHGCEVVKNEPSEIAIVTRFTFGQDAIKPILRGELVYRFAPNEGVRVEMNTDVKLVGNSSLITLPRLGMEFRMPKGSERLSYFGCGPTETYQDKRQSGRMGIHKTTVTDHFEPYIRPQENMAHTDTRWVRVTSEAGQGIKLIATEECKSFSFNCAHFSAQQLTEAQHDYELTPLEETVVNVDLLQAGIGSNSCGPALDRRYCIGDGNYRFSFKLLPVIGQEE